jgi:hypothetical protein
VKPPCLLAPGPWIGGFFFYRMIDGGFTAPCALLRLATMLAVTCRRNAGPCPMRPVNPGQGPECPAR